MKFRVLLRSARPAFLLLTPVCVLLGIAAVVASGERIHSGAALLALIGAVAAHISVNAFNEYFDFKSGLDLHTARTPFSGGSGALPLNPQYARAVLALALSALLLVIGIGMYFIALRGAQLLPFGIIGVLLIVTYTQWLNRSPLLCLLAAGVGFGPLMVVGTETVLMGEGTLLGWLLALVPFFLVNNLLLLNQYPDIEADARSGRRTFPIAFGVSIANRICFVFAVSAYTLIAALVLLGMLDPLALIGLLPLPFSLYAFFGAHRHRERIGEHSRFLAANVVAALLAPFALAVAIIYS